MTDNLKIDRILREYQPEEKVKPKPQETAAENNAPDSMANAEGYTKTVGSSELYDPDKIKEIEESLLKRPPMSHKHSKFTVHDVGRPNVSYINSVTEVRKTAVDLPPKPTDEIEGYDGAVMLPQPEDESYMPKVRRMGNSTRAKELREARKKRSKMKKLNYTYAVETPDGIYSKPEKKARKFMIHREADEGDQPEPDDNIVPLSSQDDPSALDIRITELESAEEREAASERLKGKPKKKNREQSKRSFFVKDYDSYEDANKIRRSITEIRSRISVRMNILLILTLFSGYMACAGSLGLPVLSSLSPADSPGMYCWVQVLLIFMAMITAITTVGNGLLSLIKFRPDSDSIAALSSTACLISAVSAAILAPEDVGSGRMFLYVPVGIFTLFVNAWGKKLILSRMSKNFNYISKNTHTNAVICVEDVDRAESLTRGTIGDFPILAAMKPTNFLKDFAKYTYSADMGDRFSRVFSPLVLLFSLLMAAAITFIRVKTWDMTALPYALFVFAAAVCACSCAALPLAANIPLYKAAGRYVKNHGVMLGYQSVEDFFDTNSIMISAASLFPLGTVGIRSIKLFSGVKQDTAILEAASLSVYGDSILKELFSDIINAKETKLAKVENFVNENQMGLCGWINNRRILLGSRELMQSHNIEGLPTLTKEHEYTEGGMEALYLSASGSLAAIFVIDITASPGVYKSMAMAKKYNLGIAVKASDPFITVNRLSKLFNYPEDLIKMIPQRLIEDYNTETKSVKKISASMACSGKLSSFMQLILGTKSIRTTSLAAVTLSAAAAVFSYILVGINGTLNAFSSVSPTVLLLIHLGVTALISLVTYIRKV